jgi:hypothetical protein
MRCHKGEHGKVQGTMLDGAKVTREDFTPSTKTSRPSQKAAFGVMSSPSVNVDIGIE